MSEFNLSNLSLLRKEDLRLLLHSLQERTNKSTDWKINNIRNVKSWARASNLIDAKGLTELGKILINKDPNLQATVTDWVIHFQLSLGNYPLFNYFIHDYIKNYKHIKNSQLETNTIKAMKLLVRIYTETEALAKCRFITKNGQDFSIGSPDLSNTFTVAYLLAEIWERKYPNSRSLLVNEVLSHDYQMTTILGIKTESLRLYLDKLAQHEIIEQRLAGFYAVDELPPIKLKSDEDYQIFPCWESSLELLKRAYDNDVDTPNRPLALALDDYLNDVEVPDFSQFLEIISEIKPFQIISLLSFFQHHLSVAC